MRHSPNQGRPAVTGRKGNASRARAYPEMGVWRKHEAEPMNVANSEPTKWLLGGGAGVAERVLIFGEPSRGEVGRDMGRRCDLTRGSPPVLAPRVSGRSHKTDLRGERP